jgi:hypothetical protein
MADSHGFGRSEDVGDCSRHEADAETKGITWHLGRGESVSIGSGRCVEISVDSGVTNGSVFLESSGRQVTVSETKSYEFVTTVRDQITVTSVNPSGGSLGIHTSK